MRCERVFLFCTLLLPGGWTLIPKLPPIRASGLSLKAAPIPIEGSGWPDRFPAKKHCSRCGLCETTFVSHVDSACAFLNEGMGRIDKLEEQVHGRRRDTSTMVWTDHSNSPTSIAEEARFGVLQEPVWLAKGAGVPNAQWTGVVTGIAISMLESELVDAVVCIANGGGEADQWSNPEPIIAKSVQDVLRGRGVKPALAPSLRILDEVQRDPSIKKLLFCGVGCSVQAFRAIEHELGLEEVYVLGTNCADNSPTPEAARDFIKNGVKVDDANIRGYEFMQDFRVHVKTDGKYITKPYFSLPGSIAEASIAPSCLACFDYTNALADVVVGYMGAPLESNARMDTSFQTLTIRNEFGSAMVQAAVNANRLEIGNVAEGQGSHEKTASATVASDSIILAMTGGQVKEQGMPPLIGEAVAFVMREIGPKSISFARYSIDYHILRNYLHVLDEWGEERAQIALPQYARDIVERYLASDDKTMETLREKVVSKR